jgi:hypothetical protein
VGSADRDGSVVDLLEGGKMSEERQFFSNEEMTELILFMSKGIIPYIRAEHNVSLYQVKVLMEVLEKLYEMYPSTKGEKR